MTGPTGAVRVMVATKPVDFRKGAEGLAALVHETMGADPFSGAVYVFRAKRGRPAEVRRLARQERTKPVLNALESFLREELQLIRLSRSAAIHHRRPQLARPQGRHLPASAPDRRISA